VRLKAKRRDFEIRSQLRDSKFEQIYEFNRLEFREVSEKVALHWFDNQCSYRQPIFFTSARPAHKIYRVQKRRTIDFNFIVLGSFRRYWKGLCSPQLQLRSEYSPLNQVTKFSVIRMNKFDRHFYEVSFLWFNWKNFPAKSGQYKKCTSESEGENFSPKSDE
jgi:hypothetical protein